MRTLAACFLLAACASGKPVESGDVLGRNTQTDLSEVQHVLLGWSSLETSYRSMTLPLDPRAQNRTPIDAEQLASTLLARCNAGQPFEPMMQQYSQDPRITSNGMAYTVTPDSTTAHGLPVQPLPPKPAERV